MSIHCSVVSVMRILTCDETAEVRITRGFLYKIALYASAICTLGLKTKLRGILSNFKHDCGLT